TASQQVELFDEEYERSFTRAGIATLPALAPDVSGPSQMHEQIFAAASRVVRDGKFLISLGGEHSISSGLVRAMQRRRRRLSVLQVDAHSDLRESYEGSRFSHAAVMRRIIELGADVVPVGIRNYSEEEHRFMRRTGLAPIPAREIRENPDWIQQAVD